MGSEGTGHEEIRIQLPCKQRTWYVLVYRLLTSALRLCLLNCSASIRLIRGYAVSDSVYLAVLVAVACALARPGMCTSMLSNHGCEHSQHHSCVAVYFRPNSYSGTAYA